jgi:hypothetical protein
MWSSTDSRGKSLVGAGGLLVVLVVAVVVVTLVAGPEVRVVRALARSERSLI